VILLSGGKGARFRQVPQRVEYWPDFRMTDSQWQCLRIPIQLAFFVRSAQLDRTVALYPGPAGITQSSPPEEAWRELTAENPRLAELEPDVEGLLISRLRNNQATYQLSIDHCYRLAGLMRTGWRGFSGGTELWEQVDKFFAELKRQSQKAEELRDA
jgi:hypothetical protein